ncbi:hypothetical protein B8W88_13920 [Lactococcus lactis]|uniref:Uncharacterized protein n=1 Tax=Lactococcus lactis TaxID=1358 RepID=A0AAX0PZC5_9LACT|nr:hypothetical protein B8W88_13920 [Lactococcus lactis]
MYGEIGTSRTGIFAGKGRVFLRFPARDARVLGPQQLRPSKRDVLVVKKETFFQNWKSVP